MELRDQNWSTDEYMPRHSPVLRGLLAIRSGKSAHGPLRVPDALWGMFVTPISQFLRCAGVRPLSNFCPKSFALVSGYLRINIAGPGVDSASHGLCSIKALLSEPVCHTQRSCSVVAQDEQALVRIKLLMRPRRDITHGNQRTS